MREAQRGSNLMKSMKWKIEDCFASLAMTHLGDLLYLIERRYGGKMPEQLWDKEKNAFVKSVWAMRGKRRS